MVDNECVKFLQWALPQMNMRWAGFRKIRSRVCKRIQRRFKSLQMDDVADYQGYLKNHPEEWQVLDRLCWVNISRFYRDRMTFSFLEQEVLPACANKALSRNENRLDIWSAGCASGEEPYTLSLLWHLRLKADFPGLDMHVLATDVDPELLKRAKRACYTFSSIKNLPPAWLKEAFRKSDDVYCLDPAYRQTVEFLCQDIRTGIPDSPFDIISCRNLVFTYFNKELQKRILRQFLNILRPGGALVISVHEGLPEGIRGIEPWSQRFGIYRKVDYVQSTG